MDNDERVNLLHKGLWQKSLELHLDNSTNTNTHFLALAKEAIRILEEYYGSKRYWMAAAFERDRIAARLHDMVDEIREGF